MPRLPRATRWMLLPLLVGLLVVVEVTGVWVSRLTYPYDLEWMEGGVLAHAWRAQYGLPIYPDAGPDFIPMVYTPGYYWLLGALGWIFGLSHTLGRAVSALGTLAACGALVWGAHRRLGRAELGAIGASLYLGLYTHSGAFYDLVRPDALSVGLLAWALVLATEPARRPQLVGAALLFAAFVVKHSTAAFGVPLVLGLWAWRGLRPALRVGVAAAVPGALFTAWMQWSTGGNFLAYVIDVPGSHPVVWPRVHPGTARELGHAAPVIAATLAVWSATFVPRLTRRIPLPLHVGLSVVGALVGAFVIVTAPDVNGILNGSAVERATAGALLGGGSVATLLTLLGQLLDRRIDGPWLLGAGTVATAVGVSCIMRGHHGGFVNVFMPLDWVLAAAFTVLLADVARRLPSTAGLATSAAIATAAVIHPVWTLDLDRYVPTAEDVEAGDAIVEALREVEGPVLSPYAPWMPAQAGHPPHFHLISLWDIGHPDGPFQPRVKDITSTIAGHGFGAILDAHESMGYGVAKAYKRAQVFEFEGRALMPRTGWRRRPAVIRVPREDVTP